MKKSLLTGLALLVFSGSSLATTMSCYVDTTAYDSYSEGGCFAAAWARTTTANFKITSSNGSINKVFWSGPGTSSCSQTSTQCNVQVSQYSSVTVTADVLYTNNTWESTSATAYYEGLD